MRTALLGIVEARVSKARLLTAMALALAGAVVVRPASPAHATTFSNPTPITISDAVDSVNGPVPSAATPYPSTIDVSGLSGAVAKVTVTLTNLSHGYPDDVEVLLVGPTGQTAVLMSNVGGGNPGISSVTLTFDDAATELLPDESGIVSSTYKPTSIGTPVSFPSPAPAGPYPAALSGFNGTDPNGTWRLFVVDDGSGDSGTIAGGWSLSITVVLPTLTVADARRVEGNAGTANLVFTARLSTASSSPVGVAFATQDLPAGDPRRARAGTDYLPRRGTLTVPPGQTTGTIAVPIRGDVAVEPDESFRLLLSAPSNATLARTSALGLVLDNDGPARLYVDDAERAEGQAGRAPLAFTVGLTRPSPVPVTVSFATLDGTARAPGDYAAGRGTLTFPSGVVRRTILVPVVGDGTREPDEQLRVVLSRASVGLADGVGVGTIRNDD